MNEIARTGLCTYLKAARPVMARPTMSVCMVSVPANLGP
jgi:phosphopantothenoylcysteine synthetase/decarboxylase